MISTSPLMNEASWVNTDGDGVKLVAPSETVPEALASRKGSLKWKVSMMFPKWKCSLPTVRERGPVAVQVMLTETGNVLPDPSSKTEMVALRLAEVRLLLTWKM